MSRAGLRRSSDCLEVASWMTHPATGRWSRVLLGQQEHLAARVSLPSVEAVVSLCLGGPRGAEG